MIIDDMNDKKKFLTSFLLYMILLEQLRTAILV